MLPAQQAQNSSLLTVSPPDSGFHPRREFVRDSHVPSSFALLAIAGTSFVRLSSFSKDLVSTLRFAFESQSLLRSIRDDSKLDLIEFSLEGKPWTQRKSPESERLFVHILAFIFQHGYRFLSTIDYGRESSERVCIAFSRPETLTAYEAARVPFALSFPSSKVLRVINPPLNSTPAILNAARSAWPRGVVSEKKVSNGIWEFGLKGYKWFQEDTFSSDSMQHILALLAALDRHAFTLLTSISLTGSHSRVKDLWIFAGSPMEPSSESNGSASNIELSRGLTPTGSKNALAPVWTSSSQGNNHSADTLHGKGGSLSGSGSAQSSSHTLGHVRSATEPNAIGMTRSASVLRKKSPPKPLRSLPFGQAPFSRSSEEFPTRKHDLSTIGSVDMTGIGSANQQRNLAAAGRGYEDIRSHSPRDFPRSSTGSDPTSNMYQSPPERARIKTGELFYETGPGVQQRDQTHMPPAKDTAVNALVHRSSSPSDSGSGSHRSSKQLSPRASLEPPIDVPQSVSERVTSDVGSLTPPILGSRVFRDSAFSSSTNRSYEIPIVWTGAPDGEKGKDSSESASVSYKRIPLERDASSPETDEGYGGSAESGGAASAKRSSTPIFPGGWQPSPISEIPEDQGGLTSPTIENDQQKLDAVPESSSPERKEVDAERVATPTRADSPEATRKSEVALLGVVSSKQAQHQHQHQRTQSPSREEKRQSGQSGSGSTTNRSSPAKTDGWVLVNITDGVSDHPSPSSPTSSVRPKSPAGATRSSTDGGARSKSPTKQVVNPSLSPLAKAIVVEDAKKPTHAHKNKSKSQSNSSSSALKRLFSSGSKSKSKSRSDGNGQDSGADERTRKMSLRDRWRKKTST